MEQKPTAPDPRVVRAARSLYINRRNREVIEGRIQRATEALQSYLSLASLATARLGLYDVSLEGEKIRLIKLPTPGATQLELSEAEGISEGDSLVAQPAAETNPYELACRAEAGEVPCPHCEKPLSVEQFQIGGAPEVRLFCQDQACGFEEF